MGFNKVKHILRALPLVSVLVLGWLSHQDGAETVDQSYVILNKLLHLNIKIDYYFFRDLMHLFAFFVIGFTLYVAMNHFEPPKLKAVLVTLFLLPLIAGLDEYHQSFIPGRTPSIKDIQLDLAGGIGGLLVGIVIAYTMYQILLKFRYKRNPVH